MDTFLTFDQIDILKQNFIYNQGWYQFHIHQWYIMKPEKVSKILETFIINHFNVSLACKSYMATRHTRLILEKLLTDHTFSYKKDPPHLICFYNGVYDLRLCQFRKGRYDDYCTLCTNYSYTKSSYQPIEDIRTLYLLFRGDHLIVQVEIESMVMLFGEYVNFKYPEQLGGKYVVTGIPSRHIINQILSKSSLIVFQITNAMSIYNPKEINQLFDRTIMSKLIQIHESFKIVWLIHQINLVNDVNNEIVLMFKKVMWD